MKLLKLFPSTTRGGAEEYALKMVTAAVQRGWDVHVGFPNRSSTVALRHDLHQAGAICHSLEIPPTVGSAKDFLIQFIRTTILLLKVRPDGVLLSLPLPNQGMAALAACALLKIPTAVVFHLVLETFPIGHRLVRLCQWARKRKQQWISITESNREIVSNLFHCPKDDIALIYNGPIFNDYELLSDQHKIYQDIRTQLNIPETSIIVLTVGRLSQQKGYQYLIQTIPHIVKKHPNVIFVWVGEGEQRAELELLVREYAVHEKVKFLGYRKDIPMLLLASNLFVFPSLFEGCPLALFEAMAFGLPIIASNASGIPELIKEHEHGVLFKKADSCSLYIALDWALDHPDEMRKMAENARIRVKEFSTQKMTDLTLRAVEALVVGRSFSSNH